jgi:hypothetical protein
MRDPNSLKPHQAALVLACVISVALWFLPFLRWVTVPLQYLNTHIHEAWHALSAVATNGLVSHIEVHANGNGETYTAGGSNLLISSMGYVGASLTGALLIWFSRTPKMARSALIVLSGALAYSLLVWVRRDIFGIASALAWIVALWAVAYLLDERKRVFAAQFLGVQQCLNSVQSLFFLVQISGFGIKQSDAGNMEKITHIPAIIWSVLWCAISFALMFMAFKLSWNSRLDHSPSEPESVG